MSLFSTLCFAARLPRVLMLLVGLLAGSVATCSAQQLAFDLAYMGGDTRNSGESWLGALASDAQGNVYVGGYFAGNIYFGNQHFISHANHFDVFVAKYNADGDLLWAQQAGLNGDERVRGLVVDAANNVYVTGTYIETTQFGTLAPLPNTSSVEEDVFVAKLDGAGTWQWIVGAGGSGNDGASAIALAPNGQLVVAGYFSGPTATFGTTQLVNSQPTAQKADIFVARLTTAGSWLGTAQAGGPGTDSLYGLAVDAAGTAYVCGSFDSAQLQFGATTLTNATAAGGIYDGFMAQLSATGSWQWASRLGGPDQEMLLDIALDGNGRPYVTGTFRSATLAVGATTLTNAAAGTGDIMVAALETTGSWRWASRTGSSATELGISVAVLPTGQLVVGGQFYSSQLPIGAGSLPNSSAVGDGEAFLARLDAAGNWLTGLAPVGSGEKDGRRVVVATNGTVYLAGTYWGTQATFGEYVLPGNVPFPNCYVAHVADAGSMARITSVAPATATAGQTVTLTGSGFTNVQAVRFNGVPATSYTVASTTSLQAVVPAGSTSGPLRVRTNAGTSPGTPFIVSGTLASAFAAANGDFGLWPNPLAGASALHLQLPAQPSLGSTQVTIHNSLGQLLGQTEFSGPDFTWNLHLPTGLYQLTLWSAGQPAWHQSLTVSE